MREFRRWRVRSATIRWLILIFLLMDFIEMTSATRSHRTERWQRFKRQHYRSADNGVQNNHYNYRYDHQRHPTPDLESNVIPYNVVLGQEGSPSTSSRQGATSGRWSVWSERTPCTRTCGGGVATRIRTCHDFRADGSPLCVGPNKQFLSCNTQDCPEGSEDFRAEQCSRFNNVPFDGRYYDWIPYTKAPNKCELNCMPKGENVYYRHARRVIDGTTCDPDTLDICVEGNCLPVGCDKVLGSNAKEDKCRVCGGDGSTCETFNGVYELNNLQIGYNDILVIPVGSTNILVQQKQPSNNYLAIRNLTNHYYLNGNWRIDFPRDLKFAGTTFHYERRQHGFTAPESIRATGPTKEVVYIVLLYQETNPGVHYEYSVPKATAPSPNETYNWVYGNYGECSLPCAGGYQTRNVTCAKSSDFSTVSYYLCDPQLKPEVNRTCNTQPCKASWHSGEWQNCSAVCGKGVQYRSVYCYRLSSGDLPIVVDDSDCESSEGEDAAGPKPDVLKSCISELDCPSWGHGPWTACDALCGPGEQTRIVTCQRNNTELGSLEVFPDKVCLEDHPEKPVDKKKCDSGPCEGVDWVVSEWSGCESCGQQVESRQAVCSTQSGTVFPDEVCDEGRIPDTIRECKDILPCEFIWYATQWSDCSAKCGSGVQTRKVFCGIAENSNRNENSYSTEISIDYSTETSIDYSTDNSTFNITDDSTGNSTGDSSGNSAGNGNGNSAGNGNGNSAGNGNGNSVGNGNGHSSDNNGGIQAVDDELCDIEKKYASRRDCKGTYCEAQWFTGPWNRCTTPCGAGHKTRKVLCMKESKVTNSSECDASKKLLYREPCNTHPCDEDEILTAGGCKDSKHGCCPDGVTSAGANYEGCPSVNTTDDCEKSEFGCCTDSVTHALGPFRKGCPKVYRCEESKYKCCPDGITPAKGPKGEEDCPEPDTCASTKFGCCPDGNTPATGPKFEGCDVVITEQCLTSDFGCCPDGTSAAEGSGFEGCGEDSGADALPSFKDLTELEDFGSGLDCSESEHGCCPDNVTAATGPDWEGCEESNVTDNVTATEESPFDVDCDNSTFGCCQDNITVATGPDFEGCDLIPNCTYTEHGCCPDNESPASGPDNEGCDVETTTIIEEPAAIIATPQTGGRAIEEDCTNTAFGCCLDGVTEATGPNYEGCPATEPACKKSDFGCCHDGETPAQGPNFEGCSSCTETEFGCCYDRVTPAKGYQLEGCGCTTYPYGCCPDGVTFASGENYQGCGCTTSTYGCCEDGVTEARGPNHEGCGCERSIYGCCQDGRTPAQGPNYEGCGCETFIHGCCPDGRTPAHGPRYTGCGCETWYYGCCPDGRTAARGPNQQGCGCEATRFGCCQDGFTPAQGPNQEGCAPEKQKKAGDVCGLAKERGECRNFTVKWFFDMEYGGCSRFWYGGCDGNDNRFDSQEECQQVCVAPEGIDACLLPKVVGPCDGATPAWYYDTKTHKCEQFQYSGCLGNNNRFPAQEQCEHVCQKPQSRDPCSQPRLEGPCKGYFPRWYYDSEASTCKQFVYGGCKGNDNNFETVKDCLQSCAIRSEKEDVCKLKREEGPCRDYQIKWYYNQEVQQCGQFYYGGCEGNDNRFDNEDECRSACIEPPTRTVDVCKLPSEIGNCANYEERWFFDNAVGHCRSFIYSGCSGNENNFASISECEQRCGGVKTPEKTPDTSSQTGIAVVTDDFLTEYCHLDVDAGPCHESEQRWYYDKNDGVCKHFYYGGCQGNGNRFTSKQDCEHKCFHSQDICTLPMVQGPCSGSFRQWFFSKENNACEEFRYSGCEGNGNRFDSVEDCENRCAAQPTVANITTTATTDICKLPSQPGPCLAHIASFYYDPLYGKCLEFIYGGCDGNANRFESEEGCERSCGQFKDREVCKEPVDAGPCIQNIHKWYFDWDDHICKPFYYGGCDGNGNRFSTSIECESICSSTPRKPVDEVPIPAPAPTNATTELSTDICRLPVDPGPCNDLQPQWYYHYPSSSCLPFTYGGCEGNLNRFVTFSQCMEACHPRQRTCAEPNECYTLQCPYGVEQYRDDNLCPHCRCMDPCLDYVCPLGTRCVVQQHFDEGDIPRLAPHCHSDGKGGACPQVTSNGTGPCTQECDSDADCLGERKCCYNGCGYSCLEALAATAPEVPTPSPPSRPEEHKPEYPTAVAPHIESSDPEIVTSSGLMVTLPCVISGLPKPSVEWRKSTGETLDLLADSTRYKRLLDGSLQILEVQPDDAGDYVCIATNPSGLAEKSIRLIIQDPVPAPARIIGGVKVVPAPLNEPCMLHCNAEGWPRPSVTWWRESLMLPRSSERYQQYTNFTLLIRQITVQDLGPYECRAYNGIGQVAIWEVTVYLDGPPILDPTDAKLKYFGPETSGTHPLPQPLPHVTHEHNNHSHNDHYHNHHLNNHNHGVQNSPVNGHYGKHHDGVDTQTHLTTHSSVWNLHDKDPATSPVTESPQYVTTTVVHVSPVQESLTAVINKNKTTFAPDSEVQIDCETTNSQRTLWYKDNHLVHSDERVLVFANGTIFIKKALPMDSGTYKCEAANYYGQTSDTITITIQDVGIPEDCVDTPYFANCALIVKAKYCTNKWYRRFCCRSCALSGQLSSEAMAEHLKDNLVA